MLRHSSVCRELQSGINVGRLRLAQQFGSMDGWQSSDDTRFDAYVKEKRKKLYFDGFDQRVERAYRTAAKLHKTEVVNAFKRRAKTSGDKFNAATMLEMKTAVEERLQWLREVWSQVDADYRSNDDARQAVAAKEISDALQGEPGDYMAWVYDMKREQRYLGPKSKSAQEKELENANLPDVSDDEANRYHNLKLSMTEIERNVKSKYGVAGQQHWAELQAEKDQDYELKLDNAAKVYEQLLDQSARYDESRRTALLRSNVERVHQAQVRFKAAMELEQEREKLVEAHQAMQEERKRVAKEQRMSLLQEAAELKAQGVASGEITALLHQKQLDQRARAQAEYQLRERESLLRRKDQYLDMIDRFKHDVEEREGRELLQQQPSLQQGASTRNAYGFDDADRLGELSGALSSEDRRPLSMGLMPSTSSGTEVAQPASAGHTLLGRQHPQKSDLWKDIRDNKYEDPFMTIHQARMDAAKTYDPLYARYFPMSLVQGKKYSRQGAGEFAAGNGTDGQILQAGNQIASNFHWGVSPATVHDLDADGSKDYFLNYAWHVRDKETGDIDWRYEKKSGGPVFRGPRFYRMDAQRVAADPGERPVEPAIGSLPSYANVSTTSTGRKPATATSPSADWRSS